MIKDIWDTIEWEEKPIKRENGTVSFPILTGKQQLNLLLTKAALSWLIV
jgi:hypothetical protein